MIVSLPMKQGVIATQRGRLPGQLPWNKMMIRKALPSNHLTKHLPGNLRYLLDAYFMHSVNALFHLYFTIVIGQAHG